MLPHLCQKQPVLLAVTFYSISEFNLFNNKKQINKTGYSANPLVVLTFSVKGRDMMNNRIKVIWVINVV